jgi:glycosyltransferase involved in cell wall biosynthesis
VRRCWRRWQGWSRERRSTAFPGSVSPALESRPIRTSFLQRAPGLRRHYRRYLPLFPTAIEELDLGAFDTVISSSHCVAKGVIPRPDAFHLCYCHTPMRYAWDQAPIYFPPGGWLSPLRSGVLSYLRTWDAGASPRVDLFVANSHFVAQRIRRYYGREAQVVPPPVDVDFFTPGETEPERGYCLAVSALAPYKKMDLAIAACRRLGVELRIVGDGPERERLGSQAGDGVRFLGRVGGEALRELYRGALAFVQPGVEDFGIAAVEALACGTPVVALGRGGVRDIAEDETHGVLYADEDGLAAAIDKARQIRFNRVDLRKRAEMFSGAHFQESIKALLPDTMAT